MIEPVFVESAVNSILPMPVIVPEFVKPPLIEPEFDIVAVATVDEGVFIRELGYGKEIFVLNQPYESEIEKIIKYNIIVGISSRPSTVSGSSLSLIPREISKSVYCGGYNWE